MEPLRREIVSELVGDPEPLLSSTPPCLPRCILGRSLSPRVFRERPGRWGSFSVYGVKLHLICATNGASISYELTPANVAEVRLTEELLAEANLPDDLARISRGASLGTSPTEVKRCLMPWPNAGSLW